VAGRQRAPRLPALRPDQILDAAQRLLADGGELTMDLVAEAAGLSKGTLYHYYAAKTDVLDALRQRYLEQSVQRALVATAAAPPATLRRLEVFIRALLEDATANATLVWALFHETGTTGNPHLAIVSDALRELIQQGVVRGDLAIDNADTVASFFAHGFLGRIQDAFHGPPIRPADLANELTSLLERLVTPVGR
jgi:AcrR family transcriptional regulator